MTLLHKKSKCCAARIIRFGGKRRQCTACKKTWRIHPARRGPKPLRKQANYLSNVFNNGFTVKQLALHSTLTKDAIYKRFKKNLAATISSKRIIRIRGKKLILLIDAEWQYFKRQLWTMYFLAIKPVGAEKAVILDPILLHGRESFTGWNIAIDNLSAGVKKRVIAIISDGIKGIETIALSNNWLLQKCHFHLLSMLQKMRGKRLSTPGRLVRNEIYCLVKITLTTRSNRKLNSACKRLAILVKDKLCPVRMRGAVRGMLRRLPEFRTYLLYPSLNLPTTVNVMESNNSYVRKKSKTVKSPRAWHKWAIACARYKSIFTCK